MISSPIKKLKKEIIKLRPLEGERALTLQGQIRAQQILQAGKLDKLTDAGFCVTSQTDEDGILSWLVDRLDIQNRSFIEFGVNNYRESNTRYLISTRNWRGLVIDGDPDNIDIIRSDPLSYMRDLQAVASFITADNINSIFSSAGFTSRVGILSTDIDGVDYWILEKIQLPADIIVVEYNDFLGDQPVSVPYKSDFNRHDASPHGIYWGASLAAFRHLLEKRGYKFVGTNLIGVNAFFVHGDHADSISQWLGNVISNRCIMREARDAEGQLAFAQYSTFAANIAGLPLVRVDTGETVKAGDVVRA